MAIYAQYIAVKGTGRMARCPPHVLGNAIHSWRNGGNSTWCFFFFFFFFFVGGGGGGGFSAVKLFLYRTV